MSLRDRAAISGVGETRYSRGETREGTVLLLEAALAAIADAGLAPREIDGIMPVGLAGPSAEQLAAELGLEELDLARADGNEHRLAGAGTVA